MKTIFRIFTAILLLLNPLYTNAQDIRSRIADVFRSTCRVSLILPLNSGNPESAENNNFIDFYQGLLMAVENARANGISIELNIYDSDSYGDLSLLALSGRLDRSDFIIGPVMATDLEKILPYAADRGIPVISPLDPKAEILTEKYSNLYQMTTPLLYQQQNLLNSLTSGDHTTIISETGDAAEMELVRYTTEILRDKNIRFNTFSYTVEKDKSYYNQIISKLDKNQINYVIIPSGSEAFVYDVLRNLNLISTMSGYNIRIFGTSRWRNFELVDLSYLHTMNLTLEMNYFTDYTTKPVKDFLFRYRALFKSEPNAYAFQAYDVATYFLELWYKGGITPETVTGTTATLLQSDIKMKRNGAGLVNTASRKVLYMPDYSVECRSFFR
jgi:ABC-type branched-subunit amino acid transport system substrate-binding protein